MALRWILSVEKVLKERDNITAISLVEGFYPETFTGAGHGAGTTVDVTALQISS